MPRRLRVGEGGCRQEDRQDGWQEEVISCVSPSAIRHVSRSLLAIDMIVPEANALASVLTHAQI
jgi:hypothetical protein